MKLHAYEVENGWRWTVEQVVKEENKPDTTEIIGSSNANFATEQAAGENAKHLALGILDALASRAVGES